MVNVTGSFRDFHIDIGGSMAWQSVLYGEKVSWIILYNFLYSRVFSAPWRICCYSSATVCLAFYCCLL